MDKMNKRTIQNALSLENKIFKKSVERYRGLNKFAMGDNCQSDSYEIEWLDEARPSTQPEIKRRKFTPHNNNNKPTATKQIESTQCVPESQAEFNKKVLDNQNKLLAAMESQNMLLARLEVRLSGLENNVVDKSVVMANGKMIRECKLTLHKMHKSLIRLTGEDENELQIEIAATLPLALIDVLMDVEEKLEKPEYLQAMKFFLLQLKGCHGTVDSVLKKTMKDELLVLFNFDGRKQKRKLSELTLIDKVLRDVFAVEGHHSFEEQLKKCVERSRNRFKQSNRYQKKKI